MGFFSGIGKAFSSILGGAANAVTGILGANSKDAANKATADANAAQLALAREQIDFQKDLAKSQMQWRVEDAKKAGLHPMAALGLQSTSFSPVSSSFAPLESQDYSWIGNMGQSANYAAIKGKDKQQQADMLAFAERQQALELKNMELQNASLETENEYKRWQLKSAMSGAAGQALRSPASASLKALREPDKSGSVSAGDGMYQFMETYEPGVYTLQPGNDWAQLFEDKGMLAELWPLAKTYAIDLANRSPGKSINGMVWSDVHGGWVRKGSKLDTGNRSWFADWLRRRAYSRR